jgi:hypothetical protein
MAKHPLGFPLLDGWVTLAVSFVLSLGIIDCSLRRFFGGAWPYARQTEVVGFWFA